MKKKKAHYLRVNSQEKLRKEEGAGKRWTSWRNGRVIGSPAAEENGQGR